MKKIVLSVALACFIVAGFGCCDSKPCPTPAATEKPKSGCGEKPSGCGTKPACGSESK